ncbi:CpsD/CapB family tyrosine-protein kinase [Paenilisteria rocourtiae]|uniref:non-specific protein-tyrosine kinase n=1 Tax=Listeria rocourtiae TaxID=647910 RepID=A0A4V3DPQ7_9LIST|nr:CpsD/CapB family tyrosine-protein kinase [Listeria rocourtiae]MBC1604747.1 CpsD/CapB family tyrosine-protein kinase [Listeria rocourtiae]TDR53166.1 capsular exopolysaccharide synthesis family protein [Listeria rocourtiae]
MRKSKQKPKNKKVKESRHRRQKSTEPQKLVAKLSPKSPHSELFRSIRTNIEFSSVDKVMKSILITSSEPDSGKSLICANLAVVFAQQGKKTLLIDGDLRKPTVKKIFPEAVSHGLTGILTNKITITEAICDTDIENLYVLPAGIVPPNPSELLGSEKMKQVYAELYEIFDQIIFDTPPIQLVVDAQLLCSLVDGSILLVRSDHSSKDNSKKALEKLKTGSAHVIGSIFNNQKMKMEGYYYAD